MAHSKQAKKRVRQTEKKRVINRQVKMEIKSKVRKLLEAVTANNAQEAQCHLKEAGKLLDKAARRGTIHRKNAKRRISRLAKKVQKIK